MDISHKEGREILVGMPRAGRSNSTIQLSSDMRDTVPQFERQPRLRCGLCGFYHTTEKEVQDRGNVMATCW